MSIADQLFERRTEEQKTLKPLPTVVYSSNSRGTAAAQDLLDGFRQWRLCISLSWLDIKQRYRRAIVGPFWITISMLILVLTLGTVYPVLFHQDVHSFLPYLAAGLIVWNFCTSTINESLTTFVQAEGLIKQGGIPLSLHVLRTIIRNFIINLHHIVVMLFIYMWQPALLNWNILLLIPGFMLMLANFWWVSVIFGILGTRFRDLSPVVTNLLQILFFLTPVIYRADALPPHLSWIYRVNPMYYLVEAARAPMLGVAPSSDVYLVLISCIAGGSWLAFALFRKMRPRIAYWL